MKNIKVVLLLILILTLGTLASCLTLMFRSSGCGPSSGFTTGERKIISNGIERVYFLKLPANYNSMTPYPLIFGFHGASGNYTSFTEGYYDFQNVVGEEAILVYPNGLANAAGLTQWDNEKDLILFDDLFRELEANLCFDKSRVFAVGHSAGAGFVHTLGCKRGNVLRAIAPVAGSLLDHNNCIGQVAVIQIQGRNDTYVPLGMIKPSRDYWIVINSCTKGETHEGVDPSCVAYADCDPQFPVQYCEHDGGHEWPDFASNDIWTFFKSLPFAAPSDKTGDGNVDDLGKGSISFKINYPADFVGTPSKLALALYPLNTTPPISTAPSFILNPDVPLGEYKFGEVTEYNNVEINVLGLDYGDYTLTVNIYVEGSSYPMPTNGKDYQGLQNITINSNTIVVETPFELEFVQMGF
jgi:poly(3-hydroxybutyrate) depolymerase